MNKLRLYIFYTLLSIWIVAISSCQQAPTATYSKPELIKLITSPISDRTSRLQALEQAKRSYPLEYEKWIAGGLANMPDSDIAELYIKVLNNSKDPAIVKDLCDYAANRPVSHIEISAICSRITQKAFPAYLFDLINSSDFSQGQTALQVDLWQYLCNFTQKTTIRNWLKDTTGNNDLITALQFYCRQFNYIPTANGETIQAYLLYDKCSSDSFITAVNQLAKYNYKFSIPDYGLIASDLMAIADINRASLIDEINTYIKDKEHITRRADYKDAANDIPDDFDSQVDKLSIADLIRIKHICNTVFNGNFIDNPVFISESELSETGGLCSISGSYVQFIKYPPARELGSNLYIESNKALTDSLDSLAKWHIHDQTMAKTNIAGPGNDDMKFARQMKANIVIFTIIEKVENTTYKVNIDLLTANGITIDLGTIKKGNKH